MLNQPPQLDPDGKAILDVIEAAGRPKISTLTVEEARRQMRATLVSARPPLPVMSVENLEIPSTHGALGMRLYRSTAGRKPALLFLHGGGWMLNDLDTHDDLCRRIAISSGIPVASLDFRRAPEHKHPAAVDDARLAFRWLIDNAVILDIDPKRIALMGESSGGMTAASLSAQLRDAGEPMPILQILAYPATDGRGDWPSYATYGSGYLLELETMKWFLDNYLPPDADRADPYIFPMAADDFAGLPTTLMLTAEFDPLRDEGFAYVDRLLAAGVTVEHIHAHDQMHGFLLLSSVVAKVPAIIEQVGTWLAGQVELN